MIVPIYFFVGYGGIFHNIDVSVSGDGNQVLNANAGENNRDLLTAMETMSARDDQNDKSKSCLLTGNCTR
jgi:hypothetical protein